MLPAEPTSDFAFLNHGGEMGQLMRSIDWPKTPIGAPDTWPQSLRTTLSIILHSRFPMFLFWGDQQLCFYNDAYRPSLGDKGKHPHALGKPGANVWPEIWHIIEPMITQVMGGGDATWFEDQLIPIYRNGQMEDVYWTYSYSPVSDESGEIKGVFVTCTETTKSVLFRQEVLNSQARFQNLVMQAPVAIALFKGPNFVVEMANPRTLDYWGRTHEQVINRPLTEALPELSGQGFNELMTKVLQTGESFLVQESEVNLMRNGELQKIYVDVVYVPYYEQDGDPQGVMVVAGEVTQQVIARRHVEEQVQLRTQELARAVDDLSRSNENLQQFAYIASHDLQEPLRKIQAFGDMLQNQFADKLGDGNDYLVRMQSAASRMSTLIRDLLAFARISTKQETADSVPLMTVLADVLTDLEMVIQESGAEVVVVDPLPTVRGDQSQLSQLFLNLISNALKFRKPNVPPVIRIELTQVAAANLPGAIKPTQVAATYHCIHVIDNGIGFDDQYVNRIFQVFQRLHGKNEFAGTGIGLAICEKVATNHGGAITAHSIPGEGATFSVYLPA